MSQDKEKIMLISCASGLIAGFIDALFSIYLRTIIPISEWSSVSTGTNFSLLLKKYHLLWTEQAREVAILFILLIIIFLLAQGLRDWCALFMSIIAFWKGGKLIFLYYIIDWPGDYTVCDIVSTLPHPILSPVYVTCISTFLLTILAWILIKSKIKKAGQSVKKGKKTKMIKT